MIESVRCPTAVPVASSLRWALVSPTRLSEPTST